MITNPRYGDDIILLASSKAELQSTGVGGSSRPSQQQIGLQPIFIKIDKSKVMAIMTTDGVACRIGPTYSECTIGAGEYVPMPWVSDYRRR